MQIAIFFKLKRGISKNRIPYTDISVFRLSAAGMMSLIFSGIIHHILRYIPVKKYIAMV